MTFCGNRFRDVLLCFLCGFGNAVEPKYIGTAVAVAPLMWEGRGIGTIDFEGKIAGEEHIAYADDGSGRQNVTMMVQIPTTFRPDDPCIITATSSGSRGVYGARKKHTTGPSDFDQSGDPVLLSEEHHLAEAFEFTVVRRGPGRRFT